jgi:opacity protein-like surface antigen
MKNISKIIAIATVAVSATAAQAQLYGEVGYTSLTAKATSGANKIEASPSVLGATIGYDVHKNVAVEGMFVFGLSDDTVKFNGASIPAQLKVDTSYGIFLKPKAMLTESFEVFGRLGYMDSKITASGAGLSASESDSGFAYGFGANYYFSKTTYLTVSYLNAYDKDDTKIDGVTFGLGMKF